MATATATATAAEPEPEPETRRDREQDKDPHTLEREARNRERMLKEQQRREAMTGRKRSLPGGRKLSYKYEDEEGDRARTARVEREREASRWM